MNRLRRPDHVKLIELLNANVVERRKVEVGGREITYARSMI